MAYLFRCLILSLITGISCQLFYETFVPRKQWPQRWAEYTILPAFTAVFFADQCHMAPSFCLAPCTHYPCDGAHCTDLFSDSYDQKPDFICDLLRHLLEYLDGCLVCALTVYGFHQRSLPPVSRKPDRSASFESDYGISLPLEKPFSQICGDTLEKNGSYSIFVFDYHSCTQHDKRKSDCHRLLCQTHGCIRFWYSEPPVILFYNACSGKGGGSPKTAS